MYLKVYIRRAQVYELTEKLDEALGDYTKALELDPGNYQARGACLVSIAKCLIKSVCIIMHKRTVFSTESAGPLADYTKALETFRLEVLV